MTKHSQPALWTLMGHTPKVHPDAFVAPGAQVMGRVTLGMDSSVWFNAVLRADYGDIVVGEGTNIQDLTTVHIETAKERRDGKACHVTIGSQVTIGHNCVIHGCTIQDLCIIGMGSILMNGAVIGRGSIVGAGAVVLEDTVIPPFSLVVGSPAQVKKSYPEEVLHIIREAARGYIQRAKDFKTGLK